MNASVMHIVGVKSSYGPATPSVRPIPPLTGYISLCTRVPRSFPVYIRQKKHFAQCMPMLVGTGLRMPQTSGVDGALSRGICSVVVVKEEPATGGAGGGRSSRLAGPVSAVVRFFRVTVARFWSGMVASSRGARMLGFPCVDFWLFLVCDSAFFRGYLVCL